MVFVATFDQYNNVAAILSALKKNSSLVNMGLKITVGVSGDIQLAREYLSGNIKLLDIPNHYYWARAFKYLVMSCLEDYDVAVHINDDVEPTQLQQLNFAKYIGDTKICFGEFKDNNGEIIFGGFKTSLLKEKMVRNNVEMFNGNLFILPKKILMKAMPLFTFQHAYLDFVLSYRAIKHYTDFEVKNIPMVSSEENKQLRQSVKKAYSSTWYSRANPIDSLFYCVYTHQYLRAPFVFFYLVLKAIKKCWSFRAVK